ncbi:hypothetical protein GCM10011571_24820 [Marinithermofilum abyssi]|jgi:cell division protein DivIC|uniref:Septum formation initiator family protein n=1 Tax=Marinithermofilum abyssi TaxID=1571185 RepID=A0A8J2VGP1_9BACL|nr:septum formation initiator family protein [Marinithermofilum abyssi]GGE21752.1 hypothetical protein GCM10011571_24820 [Marinithermofilum abyssi]
MMDKRSNVVSFRATRPSEMMQPEKASKPQRSPLLPGVRRRRRLWLFLMLAFFVWFGNELYSQSGQIEGQEAALAAKKAEVITLKEKQKQLKDEIRQLHDKDYLEELARKMGYSKPGEEVFDIPN